MKYQKRGVSSAKEDVHQAISKLDKGLYPNAFCKVIPDLLGGDPDYCNIMHADGAGTKSSLAYMYWKETGDLSVWEGIAQDAVVMNLDDMLCAGVDDNMLVSSTIGRNKKRIPGEVVAAIINGTESFLQKMRDLGINMVLTGGETRHDVFHSNYANKYPESYDNDLDRDVIYNGNLFLTDKIDGIPLDAGKMVLSPTRTYAPVVRKIFATHKAYLNGIIHCSGGGQTKILHFIDDLHVVKDNLFPMPTLFQIIQAQSGVSRREMYQVFNMGHRMELYMERQAAGEIIDICREFNLDAKIIGHVEASEKKKLSILDEEGRYEYA